MSISVSSVGESQNIRLVLPTGNSDLKDTDLVNSIPKLKKMFSYFETIVKNLGFTDDNFYIFYNGTREPQMYLAFKNRIKGVEEAWIYIGSHAAIFVVDIDESDLTAVRYGFGGAGHNGDCDNDEPFIFTRQIKFLQSETSLTVKELKEHFENFLNSVLQTVSEWQNSYRIFRESPEGAPIPKDLALWVVENHPKSMIKISNIELDKDVLYRLINEDKILLIKKGGKLTIRTMV